MGSEEKEDAIKSIFKGGTIVFLGVIASKFMGLGYRVLVGRYLGPADYGVISVMMAVFSVSTTLVYIGLPNGIQRYISYYLERGDREGARGTVRTGLSLITITSVTGAIILFALAPWLSNSVFSEPKAVWPIRMMALILPFRAYTLIFTRITNAFEKMQYQVITGRIYINLAKIVMASGLVALGTGYMGAAAGYAFGFGSAAFVGFYFARKEFPDAFSLSKPVRYNYGEIFRHSWPLMAAGLFGIVTGHIDTFMLQAFRDSTEVGIYQAAYPFAMLMTTGVSMFSSIFLSNASKLVSKNDKKDLVSTYRTVVKWISIVTVPVFLIIFAFPKTALIVYGSEYYGAVNVLRVLLVGFMLSALIGPASNIYQAFDRTKLNFAASALIATVNASINYYLIPKNSWFGGTMGAAIASTIAFVAIFIFHFVILYRLMGAQPFRFSLLKIWGSGLVSIGVVYALSNLLFDITPVWFFAVNLGVFSVVYGLLLLVSRTIEEEDLVVLRVLRNKTGLELEFVEDLVRRFS